MEPSRSDLVAGIAAESPPEGRLRLVLLLAFAGILLAFLAATVQAVHLLDTMRDENRVLLQASLDRSRHLDAIRSYTLLSQTYLGDYLEDPDVVRSREDLTKMQDAWSQSLSDLASYQSASLDEEVLVKQIQDMLDRHQQNLRRAIDSSPSLDRAGATSSFFGDQIVPLRTSVIEITTRVGDLDARQAASTEARIQAQFENLARRLGVTLNIALVAALVLALGCLAYILRIEAQNRRRYREIVEARGALEKLSARLVDAQETERRTISRELHDQVGQTLNALLVDAANLAKRIPDGDAPGRQYLENIRRNADSSVNSIRDIALLLRPSMLDDLGLIPALEWQAREVSRRTGIHVKVIADDVPDSLPDAVRTCVYRVVQEALHNVATHSGAKRATVNVRQSAGVLKLSVEDDGSGFDPARTRGMGLLGMEERVRQLAGHIEVESHPGKGTCVRVTLPVPVAVA